MRYRRSYGTIRSLRENVKPRIREIKADIRALTKELIDLDNYTPLSTESQMLYAKCAYILSSNVAEASQESRVPANRIRQWAKIQRWDVEKYNYYQRVEAEVSKIMGEDVAMVRARVATTFWKEIDRLTNLELQSEKEMTPMERAEVLSLLVDTALKVQGNMEADNEGDNKLEALATNVLMQLGDGSEIIDVEETEINEEDLANSSK